MQNKSILDFLGITQTDGNSGARRPSQTAENVQKRLNPTSKKKENSGRVPLKERKNDFCKEEVKEGPSKSHMEQCNKGESHTFNFRFQLKSHAVICDTSKTVLDALNTNKSFKKIIEDNMEKEIVIKRSKGEVPRTVVKTDFPCCLIEKDELLHITFIKKNTQDTKPKPTGRRSFFNESENVVIFYIKTKGGEKVKRLMKNHELRKKVDDVCVYAFKEDKLRAALQRDGRFTNVIFQKQCALREFESETIYEMSDTVEHLDRKHFEIIVISDKKQPDSQEDLLSDVNTEMNEASDADLEENIDPKEHPINNEQETPKRKTMKSNNSSTNLFKVIPDSEEILGILRSQFPSLLDTLLKRQEKPAKKSEIPKICRAEYDKSVQSFSEVCKVREIMKLSDSVCQIRMDGLAKGTGFRLFRQFILTNAHVAREMIESPDKISLEAAFDFERLDSVVKLVSVKKQFPAYCYMTDPNKSRLDFALLELDSVDELTGRPELFDYYRPGPPPSRGGICIVGHPNGGIKKMDPCFIIGKDETQKAENGDFIHVMTQKSLDTCQVYENQINYYSCFFDGSSGSPVFDEHCRLIGIHTGGYFYTGKNEKTKQIMEFSYSMQPILDMIRAQAKIKGLLEIVNVLESPSEKSDESGTAAQQNHTDYEMDWD